MNQDCCAIMVHDARSIAREASAAQAASFKRDYRNVTFWRVETMWFLQGYTFASAR